MRILLAGCNGQVGWELQRALLPLGELICADRVRADLTQLDALRVFIRQHRPDVIVNAAAYTAVDRAETDREQAYLINAQAPGVIAEEAKRIGALLLHFSTDYVFDGQKPSPYDEHDRANPLNVYGFSKLAGEQAIQAAQADYIILRTSWVYAARGKNFLKTIMRLASEREALTIVDDQHGAPTWARLIAETSAHVLKQSLLERRNGNFASAIYHVVSSGRTSWCGFAQKILELATQTSDQCIKNCIIHPIATADFPLPAKRPANSMLSVKRLEQHFGVSMPSWEISLKLCIEDLFVDK